MAKDTVILSPEIAGGWMRGEAIAAATIQTGVFLRYNGGQVDVATPAVALAPLMVSTENIATAQGLGYSYSSGENVFFAKVTAGTKLNVKAAAGTYNAGDLLEIGANGNVTALSAGVAVAVVPADSGEVVSTGGSLHVEVI